MQKRAEPRKTSLPFSNIILYISCKEKGEYATLIRRLLERRKSYHEIYKHIKRGRFNPLHLPL